MAVVVYRVYSEEAVGIEDIEDYTFSIVATDSGAEYVFPEGQEVMGLDAERIEMNTLRLYDEGEKPETPEEWADVAAYKIWGSIYKAPEEFSSVDEAKKFELALAEEAKALKEDTLDFEANAETELLVDEEPEGEE